MNPTSTDVIRSLYGAPLRCQNPYFLYVPGEHKKKNEGGKLERSAVPCGYCRVCVATRKSNWVGRLIAESLVAGSVSFVTLTYAEAVDDFIDAYADVQQMMKLFRHHLNRKCGGNTVRFFCTGERGEKRGRRHWHIMFFFEKPYKITVPKKKEHWEFWPHGWTHVSNLQPDEVVQKARYVAKYCAKSAGGPETLMRCSLRPGIGSAWLLKHAMETAQKGLAPSGAYSFLGIRHTRGSKVGQHVQFRLTGNTARNYCRVWYDFFRACYPDRRYPSNRFLRSFDDNYVEPKLSARLDKVKPSGLTTVRTVVQKRESSASEGFLIIRVGTGIAVLHVDTVGRAKIDVDGEWYVVDDSINDALNLDPDDAARIDRWLEKRRGARHWVEGLSNGDKAAYFAREAERAKSEAERHAARKHRVTFDKGEFFALVEEYDQTADAARRAVESLATSRGGGEAAAT